MSRRKRLAIASFLAATLVLLPLSYYAADEPPRFRSSATILLESRPDRVPIFQELSPTRPLPVQLAILRSRSLAQTVLDSLPKSSVQDLIDNPYYVDYSLAIMNAYRRLTGAEPHVDSPQQRALKELQEARVQFDAKSRDGIVEIKAEASKPLVAVDLASTYVEVLLSRTRSFNVDDARVSREFLEQQVADLTKDLGASEDSLRRFTTSHGGVRLTDQSQAAVGQLSQAESALAEVEANRKMVEARVKSLREKVEQQRATQATAPAPAAPSSSSSIGPSLEVKRLRDLLAKLETTLLDLRTKYTEEHPRVALVKDRIAEIQRQLGTAVKESTVVTPARGAVPPVERINFAEQVVALETSLHAMIAQEDALRGQVATLRRNLTGLSTSELEYSRLLREADNQRTLHGMLAGKLAAARIREQGEMKVVKVIDPPGPAVPATSEKRIRFFGLAMLLALVAGAGVPAAAELFDRKIENEDDVQSAVDLPVLAELPRLRSRRPLVLDTRKAHTSPDLDDNFMFAEAFRGLRVSLQLAARADHIRSILITSAFPAEGKSAAVMNLGFAFREAEVKVVLADTDFLRPTLFKTLQISSTGGLGDILKERRPIDDSLVMASEGLWAMAPTSGLQHNSRGALATNRLKELIEDMASTAQFVICDSAPLLLSPESLFLAAAVDAVILVVKAGSTGSRDFARAKAMLDSVGAKTLGVIINEIPPAPLRRYYGRHYARYYHAAARIK